MSTVAILGASGAVGRVAVQTLLASREFQRVILADIDTVAAKKLQSSANAPGMEVRRMDAGDVGSVARIIADVDVVLNCTGPFFRYARPVMEAVLRTGLDYVDVCDDVDATLELLAMDEAARSAGVTALIGMGNSPGITNILARFAAEHLLDSVESIDIYHAHGGEPFEGAGVVAHRLHGMSMDIPMYQDGKLRSVRFHEADGIALRDKVDFPLIGTDIPVYPYPHPEQITIPRHLRTRRVTNRGTVLPDEYFQLTVEISRLGLDAQETLTVAGQRVVPRDFAIAWLLRQRDSLLRDMNFGSQKGCTKVVVAGSRHGRPRTYRFSLASTDQALGEGTGIPAAMGAILMHRNKVSGPGVLPPEASVDPLDFLSLVKPVMELTQPGASFDGVLVEQVDEDGNVERVNLPL